MAEPLKSRPLFGAVNLDPAAMMACVTQVPASDSRVDSLFADVIGQLADKWTMRVIEALAHERELRFSRLSKAIPGVSQKMLTQTLRKMERDGLVTRTVYAAVPPRVEYSLTDLGRSLGAAFAGVWLWAAKNLELIEAARTAFAEREI